MPFDIFLEEKGQGRIIYNMVPVEANLRARSMIISVEITVQKMRKKCTLYISVVVESFRMFRSCPLFCLPKKETTLRIKSQIVYDYSKDVSQCFIQ